MAVVVRPRPVPARIDPLNQSLNTFTILTHAVHPLDLAIGSRRVWLGEVMIEPMRLADQIEAHFDDCDAVAVSGLFGERDPTLRKDCVDLAG